MPRIQKVIFQSYLPFFVVYSSVSYNGYNTAEKHKKNGSKSDQGFYWDLQDKKFHLVFSNDSYNRNME